MTVRVTSIGGRWIGSGGRTAPVRLAQGGQDLVETVTAAVSPLTLPLLRLVLGSLFLWFGLLKVVGRSPVGDLVARTLLWLPSDVVVPALGWVEVLLGVALITAIGLRIALLTMCLHLAGTFLTFVMAPGLMFQADNPFLLTTDGEFVVKNLVLITASLVLLTHAGRRTPPVRTTAMET